jgi:hypothetical protein
MAMDSFVIRLSSWVELRQKLNYGTQEAFQADAQSPHICSASHDFSANVGSVFDICASRQTRQPWPAEEGRGKGVINTLN